MAVAGSSFARERGASEKAVGLLGEMSAKGWDAGRMRAELASELGVVEALESLRSCRAALGAWAAGEQVYAQAAQAPARDRMAGLRLARWRQAKRWIPGKGKLLEMVDAQQAQWQAMQERRESLEPCALWSRAHAEPVGRARLDAALAAAKVGTAAMSAQSLIEMARRDPELAWANPQAIEALRGVGSDAQGAMDALVGAVRMGGTAEAACAAGALAHASLGKAMQGPQPKSAWALRREGSASESRVAAAFSLAGAAGAVDEAAVEEIVKGNARARQAMEAFQESMLGAREACQKFARWTEPIDAALASFGSLAKAAEAAAGLQPRAPAAPAASMRA